MRDSLFRIVAGVLFFGAILLFAWNATHGVDILPHGPWTLKGVTFLVGEVVVFACVGVYFVSPALADRLIRRFLQLRTLPDVVLDRLVGGTLGRIITPADDHREEDKKDALPSASGESGASGADGA